MYLSRVRISELPDKLKENLEQIDFIKNELIALASNTSDKYFDGESYVSIVDHARFTIPKLLEELNDLFIENALIRQAIDEPDKATDC
jgi:hypothetical protein